MELAQIPVAASSGPPSDFGMILVALALVFAGAWAAPRVLLTRYLGKMQRRRLFVWGCVVPVLLLVGAENRLFDSLRDPHSAPPLPRIIEEVLGFYGYLFVRTPLATVVLGLVALSVVNTVGLVLAMPHVPEERRNACRWQIGILLCIGVAAVWLLGYLPMRGAAVLGVLVLVAVAILNSIARQGAAVPAAEFEPSASQDRQRVLRMLEEGKLNASESVEILTAMGPAGPVGEPVSRAQKVAIAGALLVLVGFLLPWFDISPKAAMDRIFGGDIRQAGALPSGSGIQQMVQFMPEMHIPVRGGDIGYGLGWICLALPLAVVAVPLALPSLPQTNRKGLAILALAAGSIVLLYLYTGQIPSASHGMYITIAGYGVVWIATTRPVQASRQRRE